MIITKVHGLSGIVRVPGDKSISHRAVMLGSLAKGQTEIQGFLMGADCLSTIDCFKKLGVRINIYSDTVVVEGMGLRGLKSPIQTLNVGNSGTTMRLISGVLAPQNFSAKLDGDFSIRKRPMNRVIMPLSEMGADITSEAGDGLPPLVINGKNLKGITYKSPVASAQVKSALLLAGLYADGETTVTEPALSRNHTELMLKCFGADVVSEGTSATVKPCEELFGQQVVVPGDISSAAYFMVAAAITPDSEISMKNVGLNPTRDGIIRVIREMGADVSIRVNERAVGEPAGDVTVRTSKLKGITIGGELIPTLIDELPVIAVLACFAEGTTVIKDAEELKVKESNRIDIMVKNLKAMGADIEATDDGMIINGGKPLHGAEVDSVKDHRVAMSMAVAAMNAEGDTELKDAHCVKISYPRFYEDMQRLSV
ncbi:MAG: 3-phosphoshikimate 1-carboxyvinyltransferase [Lachnospiraceae bacterium]|nr:3-phosphoshikimate 1-carboxyvinyltransferase [Lachnospiraceae bacterium]